MGCFATVSALGASLTLAAAGDGHLTIGTEAPFPPYMVLDEAGRLTGFEYELMEKICTREKFTCDWQLVTFDELIPGVMEGRFDVALGGMAITPERRAKVAFTLPYQSSSDVEWFVGADGAPPPESAEIAVQAGTLHESFLRDGGYDYRTFPTEAATLQAVISGRTDLAFGPYSARPDLDPMLDAAGIAPLYDVTLGDEGTGMAVCLGNDALLARLNTALEAMFDDGTMTDLELRWF